MKKIPTLFKRDPDNRSRVLPELAVDLPDGAVATVKYDGSVLQVTGTAAELLAFAEGIRDAVHLVEMRQLGESNPAGEVVAS